MIKTLCFIILIILGVCMFIYGGYDDSPGAQMLGLVAVIVGIVCIIRRKKKDSELK